MANVHPYFTLSLHVTMLYVIKVNLKPVHTDGWHGCIKTGPSVNVSQNDACWIFHQALSVKTCLSSSEINSLPSVTSNSVSSWQRHGQQHSSTFLTHSGPQPSFFVPASRIIAMTTDKGKKVKLGYLYSPTDMVNQNSTLYNLGSGRWLARVNGAAAQCCHPLHVH